MSLLNILSNVFLCREEVDERTWTPNPSGNFSTKSFYNMLGGGFSIRSPCLLVWSGLAPPRVETLCWLVAKGKVSTADNL